MKNKKMMMAVILTAVLTFNVSAQQGGKSINSAEDLKKYLASQPANRADKPIMVTMKVNEQMFVDIYDTINTAGKYVNLDLSGSPITTIPECAFFSEYDGKGCKFLAGIIIPNSVTSLGFSAFTGCSSLASVTIPNSVKNIVVGAFSGCTSLISVTFAVGSNITSENFGDYAFPEGSDGSGGNNLKTAYATGKAGTYTRAANASKWTKQ